MKNELITSLNYLASKFSKHSPEILLGVGLVTGAATVYTACKATLNVENIVDEAKAEIEDIKEAADGIETNEEGKVKQETSKKIATVYLKTGVKLVDNYKYSILFGATSLTCTLASYGLMKKQTASLIAAYNTVDHAFKTYRMRVKEKYGDKIEESLYYGTTEEKVDVIEYDQDGNLVKSKKKVKILKDGDIEGYSRFFDSTNINWNKIPDANILFIKNTQRYLNDLLTLRGHVFLNEAYDMLNLPRTKEGQVVGWIKGEADGFIDLHVTDIYTALEPDTMTGYENSYMIDFNVQGVIVDQI